MKLLVVEDNQEMRRLLRRLLAGLAAVIFECPDGREAPDAYSRTRLDWVLMDIEMPVVDGITATELIRAPDPEAKIIIVTSHDEATRREARARAATC